MIEKTSQRAEVFYEACRNLTARLACAAVPAVVVRGCKYVPAEGSGQVLIHPTEADLFR